jgi:hypothetical protein
MPKQRRATPAPPDAKGRFHLGRRPLLVLLAVAALALGIAKWGPQPKRPAYRSLTQIVAAYDGFDVAESPDGPGPYEELGTSRAGIGEAVVGSFWANGKSCRFHVPAVPGEEVRVVGLLPRDGGGPTYVVLKRHVTSTPPAGQPKK